MITKTSILSDYEIVFVKFCLEKLNDKALFSCIIRIHTCEFIETIHGYICFFSITFIVP